MASPPDPNHPVLSVRIVSLDYYMAPPIPDLDFCYSSFHGEKVEEVPVVRIFGSTPAGQKTCLHIHRALPYFYVPCPEELLQDPDEVKARMTDFINAVEKALKTRSASKRQHIHGYSLVRAKKLYGYHSMEDFFVKIYLYYPHEVAHAARLLLGGTVLNRMLQPYESHIPYLLHFLVDYNLYGMGHIHASNIKFRPPLPDAFDSKIACNIEDFMKSKEKSVSVSNSLQADLDSDAVGNPAIWISSTVPNSSLWDYSASGRVATESTRVNFIGRQSTSMLEADSSVDDILNEKNKMYTSLSQVTPEFKMVQSLLPIWEEFRRSGMQEEVQLPDISKPNPKIVLRSFLHDLRYENALSELLPEENISFPNISALSDSGKLGKHIKASTVIAGSVEVTEQKTSSNANYETFRCTEEENWKKRLSFGSSCKENEDTRQSEMDYECQESISMELRRSSSQIAEAGDLKSLDTDAIGLLSWLASSQAAEDLTTDDELINEAILSPLFQTKSYKLALETAHLDYECASQQECQDILDSVEGAIPFDGQKEQTSCLGVNMHMDDASSGDTIPQIDGSSDDNVNPQEGDPLFIDTRTENDEVSFSRAKKFKTTKSSSKRNELPWGPLPLSTKRSEEKGTKPASVEASENLMVKHGESTASSLCKSDRSHYASVVNAGTDSYGRITGKTLSTCSVRDLMRRKRGFLSEQTESENLRIKTLEEEKINSTLDSCSVAPDFHVISNDLSNARLPHCVEEHLESSTTLHASDIVYPDQAGSPNGSDSRSNRTGNLASARTYETEFRGITGLSSTLDKNILQSDIQMTFIRKPPSKDQVDTIMDDSPGCIGQDAARQGLNDHLPFFSRKIEMKKQYKSFQHEGNLNSQESALGILTHFQNDGSILYLLTHAISPPTLESVQEWLLQDMSEAGINNDGGGSETSISLLARDPSSKLNDNLKATGEGLDSSHSEKASFSQQDVLRDACDTSSLQSRFAVHLRSDVPKSVQYNNISHQPGSFFICVNSIPSESTLDGFQMKQNMAPDIWHDVSQISVSDEKPELTPLSQIGFRDPASIGHGQQLTVMSVEVLAGCRGDRHPDPEHDAINMISLAVMEDATPTFEVYVLLCANNEFRRNVDGVSGGKIFFFFEEKHLLDHFVDMISSIDPDILMGWEIQGASLGFLAERAAHLGISLLKKISRIPTHEVKQKSKGSADSEVMLSEASVADVILEDMVEDDWSRTHASGVHVTGRIVLNLWRLIRTEVKLNMYNVEAVAEEILRRKIPLIPCRILNKWFSSGPGRARYRCMEYVMERAKLNLQIVNQLDMINRTSELARVFGIDFFSVLSRGSQFRVESMLLRLAHTQNYLAISPGSHQVASQPAMECIPLVMEPESGFYADPVVVLDFQSLYPSMIIAYNLCFSTCLGKIFPSKTNVLGVSSYSPDPHVLVDLKDQLLPAPNGVLYVPSKVRKGVLPRLLEEILSTRIMVKKAMKKLMPSQQVLQRIYNARQLALKLIANVTYGYTAAGFSGRMPCAELADSIVQCGRRTLETAISFVNEHPIWKARVVYGDTDSMFVLLKGRSLEEAFRIGKEIASAVTAMNPDPVTLKFEKVYHPCFLLTKKRYVGYSYESTDQKHATFDAKGIETVRRDTCPSVAKILERSIRLVFEHQDMTKVKSYVQRQWTRILSGKVSLQDFIFAKEVRLGTYSLRSSSLPPAAIVATKAMMVDPRAEPHYGERIPYVVIHGEPGARLIDMVVDPYDLLKIDSPYRLNDLYYINKQIIPALQRVVGLLGVDLNKWFSEMPRPVRPTFAKRHAYMSHSASLCGNEDSILGYPKKPQSKGSRIDTYYTSKQCILCGRLTQMSDYLCDNCSKKEALVAAAVVGSTSKLEREIQHLSAICRNCGGADWIVESGVKCISLACPVFFERRKVQKELQSLSSSAAQAGFYPCCMAELF